MANRSGRALPLITAFILLVFWSLALKKREDHSIEFDNAEFNYKYHLQVKRNGNSNREQNNHVLHHSQVVVKQNRILAKTPKPKKAPGKSRNFERNRNNLFRPKYHILDIKGCFGS